MKKENLLISHMFCHLLLYGHLHQVSEEIYLKDLQGSYP